MTLIEKLPKRLETTYPICGTVRACYSIVQRRNLFSLVSRETIFFSFFFRSDRSRSPIISHLITSHFYPSSSLSLSILSPVFSLWRTKMHCFSSFLSFFFSRARRKARLAEKRKERREENTFHPFDTIAARLNKKKKKKRRKKERKRALLSRRYSINSNDAQAHLITQ